MQILITTSTPLPDGTGEEYNYLSTIEHSNNRTMNQRLAQVALVVRDYDEAIKFYTEVLNFKLIEDSPLTPSKRWVVVQPPGSSGCRLLLAKAVGDEQVSRIGNQTGGRVFLFIYTNNLQRDYEFLTMKGVRFVRGPSRGAYGTVAVFADLYGNLIDLIEPVDGSIDTLKEDQ